MMPEKLPVEKAGLVILREEREKKSLEKSMGIKMKPKGISVIFKKISPNVAAGWLISWEGPHWNFLQKLDTDLKKKLNRILIFN